MLMGVIFQVINREQFCFADVKINTPFLVPVNNRLHVIFEIICQFGLIEMIRHAVETGVNVVISVDINAG